ncbi:RIIa domain-containing protein 1 [Fasciolopsis buskii]|uniref:RIIa domain-containing protein 1 n=1 Tax=Fasciolopsis buskii TaxID=27845 RepID=A0A8E0RPU4_9TREM|nr:RIIa domain-containing protein 1 [Fasciolopsis buski]
MDPIDVGSAKPKHDPPVAMEPYDLGGPGDLGALSNEQQWHTNILKTQTRLSNERYLRQHPEVNYMISAFLKDLLLKQPSDPRQHFTDFFTHPDLLTRIEEVKDEFEQQHHDDTVVRSLAGEDCFINEDEEDE